MTSATSAMSASMISSIAWMMCHSAQMRSSFYRRLGRVDASIALLSLLHRFVCLFQHDGPCVQCIVKHGADNLQTLLRLCIWRT